MKKQHYYLIGIIFVALSFSFYWFELRPSKIIKNCSIESEKSTTKYANIIALDESGYQDSYNFQLKKCLEQHGILK